MRDIENTFEIQNEIWGSQGQPNFPSTSHELVTHEFKEFLNHLAGGAEEQGREGGLIAKVRYSSMKPIAYYL